MKRIEFTLIAIFLMAFPVFSQNVSIPDVAFLNALIEKGIDTNGDGLISYDEALDVTTLSWIHTDDISDLTGIEAMTNLHTLRASCDCETTGRRGQIKEIDLSANLELVYLGLHCQQLTSLDVSNNPRLTELNCGNNQLTSLDVSYNTALESLDCYSNELKSLDVSKNTALVRLDFSTTQS